MWYAKREQVSTPKSNATPSLQKDGRGRLNILGPLNTPWVNLIIWVLTHFLIWLFSNCGSKKSFNFKIFWLEHCRFFIFWYSYWLYWVLVVTCASSSLIRNWTQAPAWGTRTSGPPGKSCIVGFSFLFFKDVYLFGCSRSCLWHMGSCSLTRDWTLHWEGRVLDTGPPGKFLLFF